MLAARVEGALKPGYTATCTDDEGVTITDGLSETWTAQGSLAIVKGTVPVVLWTKSSGITPTASGFNCAWLAADMGAFTAVGGYPTEYTIEFTSTPSVYKHQENVTIKPQV